MSTNSRRTLAVILPLLATVSLALADRTARAAVTPDEAAALQGRLTPIGAERAGNQAGTIPPWTGGLVGPPSADGLPWSDPFAGDRELFTIDASNSQAHAANLPEGVLAMFRHYPDYRMHVFATRRTAGFPQSVYAAVARNAVRAHAVPSGIADGVAGAAGGIPFPLPANGAEAMWNHLLAFWGTAREAHIRTYVAPGDGTTELTAGYSEITDFPYYAPGATPESVGPYYYKTRRLMDAPPALVGQGYIGWQPLDVSASPFVAWLNHPGEHRVRRAPSFSYDTPDPNASGYESMDDYYLFFGGQDRYVFRLLGKRELFVPYNNNRLALIPASQAMGPVHANQDNLRYELHRVWVVEGTLAPGRHHVAPRRRFYLDEDTWLAVYSEGWDEDGMLWKFAQSTMMAMPGVPAVIGGSEFFYDLIQGGYCYDFVFSPGSYKLTPMHSPDAFGPEAMAADSLR